MKNKPYQLFNFVICYFKESSSTDDIEMVTFPDEYFWDS